MTGKQIPKYHLAPTFSIPPSDAGGVLELGSIIESIDSAEEPINRDCHLRIPSSELFCNHQRNFSSTRSRMKSGEYGVWAHVLGADGIRGELSFAPERSDEDVYHFRSLDTVYFNPSKD
nr:uncharacterized protein CTRU02_13707 [Colletotrichum truncatum]KAF6783055.1 hypothetical protein CTRU02_13707 [Colletotrichum truncatum]